MRRFITSSLLLGLLSSYCFSAGQNPLADPILAVGPFGEPLVDPAAQLNLPEFDLDDDEGSEDDEGLEDEEEVEAFDPENFDRQEFIRQLTVFNCPDENDSILILPKEGEDQESLTVELLEILNGLLAAGYIQELGSRIGYGGGKKEFLVKGNALENLGYGHFSSVIRIYSHPTGLLLGCSRSSGDETACVRLHFCLEEAFRVNR